MSEGFLTTRPTRLGPPTQLIEVPKLLDRAFLFPPEDGRFDAGSPMAVSVRSSLRLLALSVRLVFAFAALSEEAAVASLSASELAALAATNSSRAALSVG